MFPLLPLMPTFLTLLFVHWIADFYFQTDWQAKNKSENPLALLAHVSSYSLVLLLAAIALLGGIGPLYAAINGALHLLTDFFTSKLTKKLWLAGRTHDFFTVVGADQFLHHLALGLTLLWLYQGAF